MSGRLLVVVGVSAALAAPLSMPAGASGSVWIANNARKPTIKIVPSGDAQIGWTERGVRKTMVVPMGGKVLPGAELGGKNVATRSTRWKLPFKAILRQGPRGFVYALQRWRPKPGGPTELRLSRWKGAPTRVTIGASLTRSRESLSGAVTFRRKPVFGKSPTPAGKKLQLFVLIDCLDCARAKRGKGWGRIAGRPLKGKDGAYGLRLFADGEGRRYRARVAGPNRGLHLGPDAMAATASARAPTAGAPR